MDDSDVFLEVHRNFSALVLGETKTLFGEGPPSRDALNRLSSLREQLHAGAFEERVLAIISGDITPSPPTDLADAIQRLVAAVTSETGRALLALAIMQLLIKSLIPEQSIRLHKSGNGDFSWSEGLPMRSIDKQFVTPILRKYDLIKLNADGFMMTRSLAENYPYSSVYKAAMRGARSEWMRVVETVEADPQNASEGLNLAISLLVNASQTFSALANDLLARAEVYVASAYSFEYSRKIIRNHIDGAQYSARLFEIAVHSFVNVALDEGLLDGRLKPLTQMRSANKKHGNIGDVELLGTGDQYVLAAWDSKYRKPYLLDELHELGDKLVQHPETEVAGFIVDVQPERRSDIVALSIELEEVHQTRIELYSFDEWLEARLGDYPDRDNLGRRWLRTYARYLSQVEREIAPIDEPCLAWVRDLIALL